MQGKRTGVELNGRNSNVVYSFEAKRNENSCIRPSFSHLDANLERSPATKLLQLKKPSISHKKVLKTVEFPRFSPAKQSVHKILISTPKSYTEKSFSRMKRFSPLSAIKTFKPITKLKARLNSFKGTQKSQLANNSLNSDQSPVFLTINRLACNAKPYKRITRRSPEKSRIYYTQEQRDYEDPDYLFSKDVQLFEYLNNC